MSDPSNKRWQVQLGTNLITESCLRFDAPYLGYSILRVGNGGFAVASAATVMTSLLTHIILVIRLPAIIPFSMVMSCDGFVDCVKPTTDTRMWIKLRIGKTAGMLGFNILAQCSQCWAGQETYEIEFWLIEKSLAEGCPIEGCPGLLVLGRLLNHPMAGVPIGDDQFSRRRLPYRRLSQGKEDIL